MHTSCRTHPECVRVIARFLKEQSSDMAKPPIFTSAVVLMNTATGIHRDNMNSPEPNLLVPVSHFGKGGVWIEDDSGNEVREHNGVFINGRTHTFDGKPILIPAKDKLHGTEPWEGDRIVISAYDLKAKDRLSEGDRRSLIRLGFRPYPVDQRNHSVLVGIPWNPLEFVEKACKAKHPRHMHEGVPEILARVIGQNSRKSAETLGRERTATMRRWVSHARECAQEEADFKASLPDHCQRILSQKRLIVFRDMLTEAGHGDESLVEELSQGFRLSGPIPDSHIFRARRTTASLTVGQLASASHILREHITQGVKSSGDPELDDATHLATLEELKRGWLWGPLSPDNLPQDAVITRRFGIWQSSGNLRKCRPIDNFKESLVNMTTSANESISIHGTDTIAAGISLAMSKNAEAGCPQDLLMKCYDLKKAYKNVPLHSSSLNGSFLALFDPSDGKCKIYGQFVMPFGARSSVHGFCRVSAGIWMIGVALLSAHWYSYFDDFPVVEESNSCPLLDKSLSFLFSLLGWEIADDKDQDFSSLAIVLGLEYNLKESRLGTILLQNTRKRIEDVSAEIQKCLSNRFLSAKDGERLRGRLQFLDGQLFGKLAQCAYKSLSRHVAHGGGKLSDHVCAQLAFIVNHIQSGKPRRVTSQLGDTLMIFVDACFESDEDLPAGFGGVLFDCQGRELSYFSELVDHEAVSRINRDSSGNPIFELECLAILIAVKLWHPRLHGRHTIIFTDNMGALGSMIKGHAENAIGSSLVQVTHAILHTVDCVAWFERVSSASNCADPPSRGDTGGRVGIRFSCNPVSVFEGAVG